MRQDAFSPRSLFDHVLTYCRYRQVYRVLNKKASTKIIYDLGCGSGRLVHSLYQKGHDAYGIDVKPGERVTVADLNQVLPLASDSVDVITSLANLEHLHEPLLNLREIYRVLRQGGMLVLTTPSTAAKPVLEFLAFRLKWIDPREILDHKMYFSKKLLQTYLLEAGFSNIKISRFQLGMNLYAIAIK